MRDKVRFWADGLNIRLFRTEIEAFIAEYPKVCREEETLEKLIQDRSSIARFGDGEFKLIIGERHKSFQKMSLKKHLCNARGKHRKSPQGKKKGLCLHQ